MAVRMQARSSSDGALYTWSFATADFAAAGWAGPGSAQDVAVSMRPAASSGGTTDHGLLTGLSDDDHAQYTKADGSRAFSGNQSMGSNKLTTLANGSAASQDAATVAQMEAAVAAAIATLADWKQSVRLATAAALAANTRTTNTLTANANGALGTIDGVAPAVSDRILVKDEATGANRGIYTVTSLGSGGAPWTMLRATDCDTSAEVTAGLTVAAEEGTANGPGGTGGGNVFILTTANPITVNTTALTFTRLGTAQPDGTSLELSGGTWRRAALTGDVTVPAGSNTTTIPNDTVTFAKMLNATAGSKVIGSTAAGDFAELGLAGGVERSGTDLQVSSQLPVRGGENVAVDAYPSTQTQGTVATAASVTSDVAIATGKRYQITADVWVDDGAGGSVLFAKSLFIRAHQTGGAAVIVTNNTIDDNAGSGFTWLATISGTNVRFTLANTSGSTRSYNIIIGYWAADKP